MISIPSIGVALQINNTTREVNDGTLAPAGRARTCASRSTIPSTPTRSRSSDRASAASSSFEQVRNAGPDGTLNTSDDTRILKIAASNVELTLGTADAGVHDHERKREAAAHAGRRRGRDRRARDPAPQLAICVSAKRRARHRSTRSQRTVNNKLVPVAVDEQFTINGGTRDAVARGRAATSASRSPASRSRSSARASRGDFTVEHFTQLGDDNAFGGTARRRRDAQPDHDREPRAADRHRPARLRHRLERQRRPRAARARASSAGSRRRSRSTSRASASAARSSCG